MKDSFNPFISTTMDSAHGLGPISNQRSLSPSNGDTDFVENVQTQPEAGEPQAHSRDRALGAATALPSVFSNRDNRPIRPPSKSTPTRHAPTRNHTAPAFYRHDASTYPPRSTSSLSIKQRRPTEAPQNPADRTVRRSNSTGGRGSGFSLQGESIRTFGSPFTAMSGGMWSRYITAE